ncbi:MAG: VOC family protein [Planctomycetota bacterium]
MAIDPVPKGYHTVTPYFLVEGAAKFIEFLEKAFDAKIVNKMARPDGAVMHADLLIGDSHVMMGEANDEWPPLKNSIYLYLPVCDAFYDKAVAAGASTIYAPRTEFYGDRVAGIQDPFGNTWWISTHVEDVSEEEIHRRAMAAGRG